MRVKICGIQSLEDMNTALRAGADALGFLVGITHVAEDKIGLEEAKHLIQQLPPFISSVAVTHLQKTDEIVNIVQTIRCTTVQVHNDVEISVLQQIRTQLPHVKIIKAVHVTGPEALNYAREMASYVDALLLDSRTSDRLGGTGLTHDWTISRQIVQQSPVPVILAGGLTPSNVGEAVQAVRPFGVDVNSGVEISGKKDPYKCQQFVQISKSV